MTETRRQAIRLLIKRHTAEDTKSRKAARSVLISEGIYTKSGALAPAFGGKRKAVARNRKAPAKGG